MEGVLRGKVSLLAHNTLWNEEYELVKKEIMDIWAENILDIAHIGSTAINDISAKPILDVAVRLRDIELMNIEAMEDTGYEYCGIQGEIKGHRLFVLRGENDVSLRHIHCYGADEQEFYQLVGFRDYLNSHPQV